LKLSLTLLSVSLLSLCAPVVGSAASVLISVDENGRGNINGNPVTFNIGADPGPGGLLSTLIYTIPFTGVVGDVELFEPETGIPGDVLRFNGNGTLIFYSAGVPGNTALADEPRPPAPVPNTVQFNETSNGDMVYAPTSGQPGFDSSAASTFHFVSDAPSSIPEPQSVAMLMLGGVGLIIGRLRKSGSR